MPILKFFPPGIEVEVTEKTKILAAAIRHKIPLRYGCASCQCGTCGVAIVGSGELLPMEADEHKLLSRMQLPTDGSVRLACRSRVLAGCVEVDLSFQSKYSPDTGLHAPAAAPSKPTDQ